LPDQTTVTARRQQHRSRHGHPTSKPATKRAAVEASKEPVRGMHAPASKRVPDRFDRTAFVEHVRWSRAEQGFPPTIGDPTTLERVAALLADCAGDRQSEAQTRQ